MSFTNAQSNTLKCSLIALAVPYETLYDMLASLHVVQGQLVLVVFLAKNVFPTNGFCYINRPKPVVPFEHLNIDDFVKNFLTFNIDGQGPFDDWVRTQ